MVLCGTESEKKKTNSQSQYSKNVTDFDVRHFIFVVIVEFRFFSIRTAIKWIKKHFVAHIRTVLNCKQFLTIGSVFNDLNSFNVH